jgi:hypothetical protein
MHGKLEQTTGRGKKRDGTAVAPGQTEREVQLRASRNSPSPLMAGRERQQRVYGSPQGRPRESGRERQQGAGGGVA